MNYIILVAVALAAVVVAAPPPAAETASIIHYDYEQSPDGNYKFEFQTDDGIARSEVGTLKETLDDENKPHKVVVVRGSFTYTDSNGEAETITYYADETGFYPLGDSIPKPVQRR